MKLTIPALSIFVALLGFASASPVAAPKPVPQGATCFDDGDCLLVSTTLMSWQVVRFQANLVRKAGGAAKCAKDGLLGTCKWFQIGWIVSPESDMAKQGIWEEHNTFNETNSEDFFQRQSTCIYIRTQLIAH